MGCTNASIARAAPLFLTPRARPFVRAILAVVSRSAHVLADDLLPPEEAHIMADCFDAPPESTCAPALAALFPDAAGVPALTASMAACFWDPWPPNLPPNLRDCAAPSTYACHPFFPALAVPCAPVEKWWRLPWKHCSLTRQALPP